MATDMEEAFFSIIIDAAIKMAEFSKSKLFIIHDSSDGTRSVFGDRDLINCFQSGQLTPGAADKIIPGQREEQLDGLLSGSDVSFSEKQRSGFCKDRIKSFQRKQQNENHATAEVKRGKLMNNAELSDCDMKPVTEDVDCKDTDDVSDEKPDWGDDNEADLNFEPKESSSATLYGSKYEGYMKNRRALSALNYNNKTTNLNCKSNESLTGSSGDKESEKDERRSAASSNINGHCDSLEDCRTNSSATDTLKEVQSNGDKTIRKHCGLCPPHSSKAYTLKGYRKHKAGFHDRKVVCPICDAAFPTEYYLKRHEGTRGCPRKL